MAAASRAREPLSTIEPTSVVAPRATLIVKTEAAVVPVSVIADGSPLQGRHVFEVKLRPIDAAAVSFESNDGTELDDKNQLLLRDVHPGKYRMSVTDRLAGRVVYEANVEAKEGKTVWTVPLPAGSISERDDRP